MNFGAWNAIVPMSCVTAAALAATGVILSATYMLWMFQRVNYGPVTNEKNAGLKDLQPREWLVIAPIVAAAILMGVLPNLFLKPMEPSVTRVIAQVQQNASQRIQAKSGSGVFAGFAFFRDRP